MTAEPSSAASLMSPPPPPAMSPPPPPVTYVPYVPLPTVVAPNAAPAPMGIVADQALPQAALAKLLAEATGMAAPLFCTRLQSLWPEGEAAPPCPTTDGQHQWPAPLSIVWQVDAGQVVRAEQQR